MASPPLVLPGALFVGEDDRARIIAHTGPAAGWHVPRGILGWSHEVSVVAREALTEDIRKSTKIVMPAEQIPPARMPLTAQAAQKSPLVAVSSKIVSKLVELGVRVHTVGVDRVTSSFYYLAEGGGEEQIRIEGDLVQSVGAMLGDRADNAAIERVLDGLPDRLLRALSKDRVSELTIELAAALPRAAADGSGTSEVDLDAFEKDLAKLIGQSEKNNATARELAAKLEDSNERRLDVPIFGDARKVSQGPFDLTVGDRRVSLPTYERWIMSAEAAPAAAAASTPAKADANDALLAGLEAKGSSSAAADAEAAKKRADEEAAAKKRADEEAAKKRAEADAAAKKKAEEEAAAAKKKAEEEAAAAAKKAEEEAAAAAAKKKAEEEAAAAAKKAEEEAAAAAKKEEEAAAKKAAAAAAKKADEAPAKKKAAAKADDDDAEPAAKAKDDKRDTVKVKRAEPEKAIEKKSNSTMWFVVLAVVLAVAAYWKFFMHK